MLASTPSERVFSRMGQIVNKLRTRLSPSTVEAIIFLTKNDFAHMLHANDDDI